MRGIRYVNVVGFLWIGEITVVTAWLLVTAGLLDVEWEIQGQNDVGGASE